MIMVTHQMGFAREISDRVCFFTGGRILEQGPPSELLDNPKNERTKQFLHAVLMPTKLRLLVSLESMNCIFK